MKTKTTITEITHDDLVNLLSTATCGSSWLETWTPAEIREKLGIEPGDCREDIQAKALLSHEVIVATDNYAEGEKYGEHLSTIEDPDDEGSPVNYYLVLDHIKDGIAAALDGTFKANDDAEIDFAATCARQFIEDCRGFCSDFDITAADALMQIIMFNEIIYG